MPRNGSGLYVPPPANYPAVSATTITAADRNAIDSDLATALTNSIAVNGESFVTADIPFGNNKLTGVKDGTLAKDAANVSQIQNSNAILLASVAGTDTITASLSPALTAYANGQIFTLIPANSNTGAVTININGLGAKSITKNGSTALVAGDLVAGVTYSLQYDGTRFQKIAGSDYAKSDNYAKSGANSDITSLSGLTGDITGLFSGATIADRVLFKTSTTNAGTVLTLTPNGTSATSYLELHNSSTPDVASSYTSISVSSGVSALVSGKSGAGSYLPLAFYTSNSEKFRIGTNGQIGLGGANYGSSGNVLTSNGSGSAPTWQAFSGLGVGQTWQDLTGSRSSGVTYTNSTGKPIQVIMSNNSPGTASIITVGGVTIFNETVLGPHSFIVPDGSTYVVSGGGGVIYWSELR